MPNAMLAALACLLWIVYGIFEPAEVRQAALPKTTFHFESDFKPFVAKYCIKCHTRKSRDGGVFAINLYPDAKSLLIDKQTWSLAADYLDGKIMPPRDSIQPSPEERRAVADWMRKYLKGQVD